MYTAPSFAFLECKYADASNRLPSPPQAVSSPGYPSAPQYSTQLPMAGRHRVTTTLWEDEGTLCFQVDAKGVCVARRHGEYPTGVFVSAIEPRVSPREYSGPCVYAMTMVPALRSRHAPTRLGRAMQGVFDCRFHARTRRSGRGYSRARCAPQPLLSASATRACIPATKGKKIGSVAQARRITQ